MKLVLRAAWLSALALILLAGVTTLRARPAHSAAAHHYVCTKCNLPCDAKVFDKPGTCPDCGMALVEEGAAAAEPPDTRRKVAILLFNGAEIIDYTGPYELFGAAGYNVYTVAASTSPITTAMGMAVVPKYDFASAPEPDLLLVPGGGVRGAMNDSTVQAFVKATAARAPHTMSVCNGAFILAQAGVLDGLTATTTYGNVMLMQSTFPKVHVVGDRRYVDNGRVVTTAGLSAGMDGALHMIAKLDGEATARQVALSEEYAWNPDGGYVRPALADRMLPRLNNIPDSLGTWQTASSTGDANHWTLVAHGSSTLTAAGLLDALGGLLATNAHWTKSGGGGATTASDWSVPGIGGERWRGRLEVEPQAAAKDQFTARVIVSRAGRAKP